MTNLTRAEWRRSSRSQQNGQCVELAYTGAVRDSKNPGPTVIVDVPALVAAVKADAFTR